MSSPLPPPPEVPRRSTPFWKSWWFWAVVVVVILIAAGVGGSEIAQTEADIASPSPIPSPTAASPAPETAQVPDVEGKSVDVATSELEAAGFVVRVETKLTNAAQPGRVLQQSVTGGSLVEVGDTIGLNVAEALRRFPRSSGRRSPTQSVRSRMPASTSAT
jgi:multidrug efflux pump subunit AcrA (membrane-fusion protein)